MSLVEKESSKKLKTDPSVMDAAEENTAYGSGIDSDGQDGDDGSEEDTVDGSGSDCEDPAGAVELTTDAMVEEMPEEVTDYDTHSDDDLGTGDEFKNDYCFMCVNYDTDEEEDVLKQFEIYRKELRKYEGFHVESVPKVRFFGAIRATDIDGEHAPEILRSTQFAIKKHNRKNGTNLEFVKIQKANIKHCSGFEYFITFDARDSSSGETKTYQTQVYFPIKALRGAKNGIKIVKFRLEKIVDLSLVLIK